MDCKKIEEVSMNGQPELEALRQARRPGWGQINQQRLRNVEKNAGRSVLDLGCDSGAYVGYLIRKGFFSCGLDIITK